MGLHSHTGQEKWKLFFRFRVCGLGLLTGDILELWPFQAAKP